MDNELVNRPSICREGGYSSMQRLQKRQTKPLPTTRINNHVSLVQQLSQLLPVMQRGADIDGGVAVEVARHGDGPQHCGHDKLHGGGVGTSCRLLESVQGDVHTSPVLMPSLPRYHEKDDGFALLPLPLMANSDDGVGDRPRNKVDEVAQSTQLVQRLPEPTVRRRPFRPDLEPRDDCNLLHRRVVGVVRVGDEDDALHSSVARFSISVHQWHLKGYQHIYLLKP
mmetsp:Transcript_49708/g.116833  ORF Transcript_49708/g.116833 Transcript_49708/m.116833 type:complete len:225 (-) Transcript_49708:267-941(-)